MKATQTLLATAILFSAASAQAALVASLDGQTVYDTDLDITWLANANLAATNSFGLAYNTNLGTDSYGYPSVIYSSGTMTWGGAQKWIAAMNAANYLGYSDWRLPVTTDTGTPGCNSSNNGTDCGYNSVGSEMAHLYYNELGNKGFYSTTGAYQPDYGLANQGPFSNFQSDFYWSGTEYAPFPYSAWFFYTGDGKQFEMPKAIVSYALAVRPGQIVATPVPAAAWLLGSGLLGLIGLGRRRLALR